METTPLAPLKKGEIIGGFIYLPMFLLFTSLYVSLIVLLPDLLRGKPIDADRYMLPVNFWTSVIHLIAVCCIFARFLWGQFSAFRGSFGRIAATLAIGYGILLVGNLVMNLLTAGAEALGLDYENANQQSVVALLESDLLPTLLIALFSAPIVEECLFRGLIFGLLHRKSRAAAYLVSMAAFSLAHVFQSLALGTSLPVFLLNFVTYLPMGFAFCWVYERCRSIWAPILLHFFNNAAAVALTVLLPDLNF